MLRVMLVDDEPSAIKVMELLFKNFKNIHIVGLHTSGEKALSAIDEDKPDAIFVDIQMPGKNGLDIALEVADKHPEIDIVFVTAYSKYAVAAFETSVVDYLLKPVRKERLDKTVKRLENNKIQKNKIRIDDEKKQVRIQCFRKFTIYMSSGKSLRWRTRKVEELMAFFVHNRHEELSKEMIINMLWPEIEVEKANMLFHTTMYNLKKALRQLEGRASLKKVNNGYRLYLNDTTCDVDDFERIMLNLRQLHENSVEEFEEAMSIYTGNYYEEDGYLWAENKRFELQSKMTALCMEISRYYQRRTLWEKAVDALRSILKIDDMNQVAYEMLILIFGKLGNTGLMLQTYDRYQRIMEELGIPSKSLEVLKESMQ